MRYNEYWYFILTNESNVTLRKTGNKTVTQYVFTVLQTMSVDGCILASQDYNTDTTRSHCERKWPLLRNRFLKGSVVYFGLNVWIWIVHMDSMDNA